jgi:hypothetical protein
MRSQASEWAAGFSPEITRIPVLKSLHAWKAIFPEALGRAEGRPAGWRTAARSKRTTR